MNTRVITGAVKLTGDAPHLEPISMIIRALSDGPTKTDKNTVVRFFSRGQLVELKGVPNKDPKAFSYQFSLKNRPDVVIDFIEQRNIEIEIVYEGLQPQMWTVKHDLMTTAPLQILGIPNRIGAYPNGFPKYVGPMHSAAPYVYPEALDTGIVRFDFAQGASDVEPALIRPFMQYLVYSNNVIHGPAFGLLNSMVKEAGIVQAFGTANAPHLDKYNFKFDVYTLADTIPESLPAPFVSLRSPYLFRWNKDGNIHTCDIELRQKIYGFSHQIAARTYLGALFACSLADLSVLAFKEGWTERLYKLFRLKSEADKILDVYEESIVIGETSDVKLYVDLTLNEEDGLLYNEKCEELYNLIQTSEYLAEGLVSFKSMFVADAPDVDENGNKVKKEGLSKRQRECVYTAAHKERFGRLVYSAHPDIHTFSCFFIASAICLAYDAYYGFDQTADFFVSPPMYDKLVCLMGLSQLGEYFTGITNVTVNLPMNNFDKGQLRGLIKIGLSSGKYIGCNLTEKLESYTLPRKFFALENKDIEHWVAVAEQKFGGELKYFVIGDGLDSPSNPLYQNKAIGTLINPSEGRRVYTLVDEAYKNGEAFSIVTGYLDRPSYVSANDVRLVIGG